MSFALFVGDIHHDVGDYELCQFFQQYYSKTHSAQVMIEPTSGQSYGYGIVRFSDQSTHQRALTEMNGQVLNYKPITVAEAPAHAGDQEVHEWAAAQQAAAAAAAAAAARPASGITAANFMPGEIVTVFVGNLAPGITEEELRSHFGYFGEIVSCRIPGEQSRPCGFVEFADAHAAEAAITQMNGQQLGDRRLRCEWGKSRTGGAQLEYQMMAQQMMQYQMMQAQLMQAQQYAAQQAQIAKAAQDKLNPPAPQVDFTKPFDVEGSNSEYLSNRMPALVSDIHSRAAWTF